MVYFCREHFSTSLDGRRLDLLTISSIKDLSTQQEDFVHGCFPQQKQTSRCYKFSRKPVIFFSARVHPGEVPASHIMHGILAFLSNFEDPQVMDLLDNFVFKIVPIINPDGVARGHYRLDSLG